MDRPSTIQLLETGDVDFDRASRAISVPIGIVVVEMLPEPDRIRSILIPETVAGKLRPDIGVVIGVGPNVPVEIGWKVAVLPYEGQWLVGFETPLYSTSNQVRILGTGAHYGGEMAYIDVLELIPMRLDEGLMIPVGRKILLERLPEIEREGNILLADAAKYRQNLARVVRIGDLASVRLCDGYLQPGDLVHYHPSGVLDFEFADNPHLCLIDDISIDFKITEDGA